jgi:hypothetical protein
MVVQLLKRVAARLPPSWQHELRRFYFRCQIRGNHFFTDEREYELLPTFLKTRRLRPRRRREHWTLHEAHVGPRGRDGTSNRNRARS